MRHPKEILQQFGLQAKKSLGQNFLFDPSILERVAAAAQLEADDQVLEIGAGLGALTRVLARQAGRIVTVELDERLLPILEQELEGLPQVELVHGDILAIDPADHFSGPYSVVANVPYYITGAILRHILSGQHKPERLVLTVQQEVARRLAAGPGDMSLLAVSVQYYGRVEIVEQIKAGAFWPRPGVDSAVIAIELKPQPLLPAEQEAAFFRLVKTGFSQKRKQLQKNLRRLGHARPAINQALQQAGIDGRRRAETLSLTEWHRLLEALTAV